MCLHIYLHLSVCVLFCYVDTATLFSRPRPNLAHGILVASGWSVWCFTAPPTTVVSAIGTSTNWFRTASSGNKKVSHEVTWTDDIF